MYQNTRNENTMIERAELHVHTKLSDSVSLIDVYEVMQKAEEYGINTIAFTNLGNVQDFPTIARAHKKYSNLKIIYGAEVFYVDQKGKCGAKLTLLAKNQSGIKALYKIISAQEDDGICNIVSFETIQKYRKDLLIGSSGNMGGLFMDIGLNITQEELQNIAQFYDYLEIYPTGNHEEKEINKKIFQLGEQLGIPVVACGNCHYISPADEICRRIVLNQHYECTNSDKKLYLHKTGAMLTEFEYLGINEAYKAVIETPLQIVNLIANDIKPLKEGMYFVALDGATKAINDIVYKKAYQIYGNPLPKIIDERLKTELSYICYDEIATHYILAYKIGDYMRGKGYNIGNRGTVGSALVAYLLGIGETNPLPPHYYCSHCSYVNFDVNEESGFDLPDKNCPYCGKSLIKDGHNIPYQTFMGARGDKWPDIDINVPMAAKDDCINFIQQVFGGQNTAFAGTVYTVSDYRANMYISDYEDETGNYFDNEQREYIKSKIINVKFGEGRHPAGVMVLPADYEFEDFTPVRMCEKESAIDKITHFDFHALYDNILKVDTLGHKTLDFIELLKSFTGESLGEIKFNDPQIYNIFNLVDTLGIPEYDTEFVINLLKKTKPDNFSDLVKISGLCHGTDVWLGNGEMLIEKGFSLAQLPSLRDDIMLDLIKIGLDENTAFRYGEMVRKGLFAKNKVNESDVNAFKEGCKTLGDWYFDYCSKVRYMFPKAHAVSYVINAVKCAHFKIHHPTEFYAAYFSTYFDKDEFDYSILLYGSKFIDDFLEELLENNLKQGKGCNNPDIYKFAKMAKECIDRGINFLPPDSQKSHSKYCLPEEENIRLPLLNN